MEIVKLLPALSASVTNIRADVVSGFTKKQISHTSFSNFVFGPKFIRFYCRNVNIRGVSIVQPYESPNTDGINPESCNGVRISNCYVDCGDDCITLKSGYNEHGRKVGIPCENVTIMNCTFAHGRSAVGIGSEMSGGVRNVTIMNCVFKGTLRGLRVKTGRGRGGVVSVTGNTLSVVPSYPISIEIPSRRSSMIMPFANRFSTTPPRPRPVFTLKPRSVPLKTQFIIVTFRTPPDISLPIPTALLPWAKVQFIIVTFSHGIPTLRPCSL